MKLILTGRAGVAKVISTAGLQAYSFFSFIFLLTLIIQKPTRPQFFIELILCGHINKITCFIEIDFDVVCKEYQKKHDNCFSFLFTSDTLERIITCLSYDVASGSDIT